MVSDASRLPRSPLHSPEMADWQPIYRLVRIALSGSPYKGASGSTEVRRTGGTPNRSASALGGVVGDGGCNLREHLVVVEEPPHRPEARRLMPVAAADCARVSIEAFPTCTGVGPAPRIKGPCEQLDYELGGRFSTS